MAYGKYIKKKAKQATKAVGKRYGISYGRKGVQAKKNSVMKIAKDLMWVKSRLNVEKKFKDDVIFERSAVGQVDVNGIGYAESNLLLPHIFQGTGEDNRVGNSIRATGMVLHMNFIKQAGASGPRRIKVCVVKTRDDSMSPTDIFDSNPLTGLIDYHSNVDYTELKDKTAQIIATKYVKLGADGNVSGSGDAVGTGEASTATIKIPIKLSDVLRYEANANSLPANMRYHLIVMCDNGNRGLSASTINGVLVKGVQSGVDIQCHRRFWYVDN